jgi:hypothetical protein
MSVPSTFRTSPGGPAAFRKRDCAWIAEVADMYPACLIGSPFDGRSGERSCPAGPRRGIRQGLRELKWTEGVLVVHHDREALFGRHGQPRASVMSSAKQNNVLA